MTETGPYTLVAYSKVDVPGPGFALTLFRSSVDSNCWYYQEINELDRSSISYTRIDIGEESVTYLNDPPSLDGSRAIFCFIDENNEVFVGHLSAISPILERFRKKNSEHNSINMQILSLMGNNIELGRQERGLVDFISNSCGLKDVSASLARSIIRGKLWDYLLQNVKDNDGASWLLLNRGRIVIEISAEGSISIGLDGAELHPSIYFPDFVQVKDIMGHSQLDEYLGVGTNRQASERYSGEFLTSEFRGRLSRATSSSERMFLVFQLLMLDPKAGFVLLEESVECDPTNHFSAVVRREFRRASTMFGSRKNILEREWNLLFFIIKWKANGKEFHEFIKFIAEWALQYPELRRSAVGFLT